MNENGDMDDPGASAPPGLAADEVLGHGVFTPHGGGIRFGRPELSVLDIGPDGLVVRLDIAFELDEPGETLRCTQVRHRVELGTPGAAVRDLGPGGTTTEQIELADEVTAFVWTLTPGYGQLAPGVHRAFAVLHLPLGSTGVSGRFVADARMDRERDGDREVVVTRRCAQPFAVSFMASRGLASTSAEPPPATSSGRVVSTGLSTPAHPDRNRPPTRTAAPDTDYLFWLFVGDTPAPDAIDDRFVELDLPPDTPVGVRITVALFAFPGEITITGGADIGELVLRGDGRVEVARPPSTYTGDRLLFPIRTPPIAGVHRLRCSIYCGGTLLQSRLVEVEVAERESERAGPAVRSTTDYLVDTTLDPAALDTMEPVTLSVFLNDNGDGTHGFRFFGGAGIETVKADVVLGAMELQDDIERARRTLRRTAWAGGGDWAEGTPFRYAGRREPDLAGDLIDLARAGYRLWTTIGGRVARERQAAAGESGSRLVALQALLRSPGTVEFATKYSAGQVVPAAVFYDLPLDTEHSGLTVCATAMAAIDGAVDLVDEPCFRGECPNRARTVVCPGGFWGFRHRIGLPQSVRAGTVAQPPSDPPSSAAARITFTGNPHVVVGVATEFAGNPHPGNVADRGDAGSRPVVADRAQLLDLLRTGTAPHLVYLFCHGLVSDTGLPALRVGPAGADLISPDTLADMFWDTHPLVILNGCRTTAIEPRHALNFVDVLVRDAAASGVVGTEIVTNEALAASFAELLLDSWFRPGTGLGEAMRRARLGLLARGNPLGMIYVSYAAPQLRLMATP